jgi:heme-degrading monooxygenase HmoA
MLMIILVIGQTNWQRKDERGAVEFVFISYWRSVEDLHVFAHGPLHREAWTWWEKTLKQHDAIGINHEIYEAEPGHWENMYTNFQPTGLGATSFPRRRDGGKDGNVTEEWVSSLVDARKGKLAKSSGRLGMSDTKYDANRPNGAAYV